MVADILSAASASEMHPVVLAAIFKRVVRRLRTQWMPIETLDSRTWPSGRRDWDEALENRDHLEKPGRPDSASKQILVGR